MVNLSQETFDFEEALKEEVRNLDDTNDDVSRFFKELSKTHEALWQEDSIYLSMIDVQIHPPFKKENVKAKNQKTLERIQKVVNLII